MGLGLIVPKFLNEMFLVSQNMCIATVNLKPSACLFFALLYVRHFLGNLFICLLVANYHISQKPFFPLLNSNLLGVAFEVDLNSAYELDDVPAFGVLYFVMQFRNNHLKSGPHIRAAPKPDLALNLADGWSVPLQSCLS